MMLPEDLMLLFLDEVAGGARMDRTSIPYALAGAVLLELVNSGRVAFEPNGKKLSVVDPTPLTNAFLQESLTRLDKPMKPQRAVEKLRKGVRDNVMAQLDARGVLTVEKSKVLGIFPMKTYTLHDVQAVIDLRLLVGDVAAGHRGPDERTGSLITLLHAVKGLHKVFQGNRREMNARAKEIANGSWAGDAVKKALQAVHGATAGALAATVAAASGA